MMMCRNSNTNKNATSGVTPKGNSATRKWSAINRGLLARARANDPSAQFQLGMITLCEGRVGFARAFLRYAAKKGNPRAKQYLKLLHERHQCAENWRQQVIQLEAEYIAFGDYDSYE